MRLFYVFVEVAQIVKNSLDKVELFMQVLEAVRVVVVLSQLIFDFYMMTRLLLHS